MLGIGKSSSYDHELCAVHVSALGRSLPKSLRRWSTQVTFRTSRWIWVRADSARSCVYNAPFAIRGNVVIFAARGNFLRAPALLFR